MCVRVCVRACVCACVRACVCACAHACMPVGMHVCMLHACVPLYMPVCTIHACMYACTHTCSSLQDRQWDNYFKTMSYLILTGSDGTGPHRFRRFCGRDKDISVHHTAINISTDHAPLFRGIFLGMSRGSRSKPQSQGQPVSSRRE